MGRGCLDHRTRYSSIPSLAYQLRHGTTPLLHDTEPPRHPRFSLHFWFVFGYVWTSSPCAYLGTNWESGISGAFVGGGCSYGCSCGCGSVSAIDGFSGWI